MNIAPRLRAAPLLSLLVVCGLAPGARASTFIVGNLNDAGPGSLRTAINNANSNPGPDDIVFTVSGTIGLMTSLPALLDDTTRVLGETAPLPGAPPRITLQNASTATVGIDVAAASGCTVRGLRLTGFVTGILVHGGATGNLIGDVGTGEQNVETGDSTGIALLDPGTDSNTLYNNVVYSNIHQGILVSAGSQNVIGGLGTNERNAVYQNEDGIVLDASAGSTLGNRIEGNYVGPDTTGTGGGGNSRFGIWLTGGVCENNYVLDNVVTYNQADGIRVEASRNVMQRNWVGIDVAGTASPNLNGIAIFTPAMFDTIGPGNVLSGNVQAGMVIEGSQVHHYVWGNYVGTDPGGVMIVANGTNGIVLNASANRIGGPTPPEGNLIRGNTWWGITGSSNGQPPVGNIQINEIWGNTIDENGFGGILCGQGWLDNLIGDRPGGTGLPNAIRNNTGPGVEVGEITGVASLVAREIRILTNEIFGNTVPIVLTNCGAGWGNDNIPPPTVTGASATTVSGTTNLPGYDSIVQVFCDIGTGLLFVGETSVTAPVTSWSVMGTIPTGTLYATNTSIWPGTTHRQTSPFSAGFPFGPGTDAPVAEGAPTEFGLAIAGPNPVRDATSVVFSAARETRLAVEVHDVTGRRVRTLFTGRVSAGLHPFRWEGRDEAGRPVAAGVYFVRARWSGGEEVRRIAWIR